jgi:hypothetical protein
MARLHRHYVEYRRLGFGRGPAFRLAWLVAMELVKPIPARAIARRS